jgi:hypothetical protein
MNLVLWMVQGCLCALSLMAGGMKVFADVQEEAKSSGLQRSRLACQLQPRFATSIRRTGGTSRQQPSCI